MKKKHYCVPVVEILTARVECGFAASLPDVTVSPDEGMTGSTVEGGNWRTGNTNGWWN